MSVQVPVPNARTRVAHSPQNRLVRGDVTTRSVVTEPRDEPGSAESAERSKRSLLPTMGLLLLHSKSSLVSYFHYTGGKSSTKICRDFPGAASCGHVLGRLSVHQTPPPLPLRTALLPSGADWMPSSCFRDPDILARVVGSKVNP